MSNTLKSQDLIFFVVCLALGGLAELSFFHAPVGVSAIVFVFGFYLVFFIRFRHFAFRQRRMGMLVMFVILVLASNYFLYDAFLFKALNALLLPSFMLAHLVLLTKPAAIRWHQFSFLKRMVGTVFGSFVYNTVFMNKVYRRIFKGMDEKQSDVLKKILLGLLIGVPLLMVVVVLLMQADQAFQNMLAVIPDWLVGLEINEVTVRVVVALALGWLFFGVLQILTRKAPDRTQEESTQMEKQDGIVSITILLLLNIVYVLFTAIQFTYFFGGELYGDMSYAEYARRGFFELIMVSLLNLTVLLLMLTINRPEGKKVGFTLRIMYTLLIFFSGIMLISAFNRLMMYEAHYGFTMARVLPHVFMIFLLVIFVYTCIRVWMDRLPLIHFYILTAVLFYTGLNAVNVEAWIVDRNIERYQETGKLDVHYLNSLSYTGVDGLLDVYELNPDIPQLEKTLEARKALWTDRDSTYDSWQSFTIPKYKVIERLQEWNPR